MDNKNPPLYSHLIHIVEDVRNEKVLLFSYEWKDWQRGIDLSALVHALEVCAKKIKEQIEPERKENV